MFDPRLHFASIYYLVLGPFRTQFRVTVGHTLGEDTKHKWSVCCTVHTHTGQFILTSCLWTVDGNTEDTKEHAKMI